MKEYVPFDAGYWQNISQDSFLPQKKTAEKSVKPAESELEKALETVAVKPASHSAPQAFSMQDFGLQALQEGYQAKKEDVLESIIGQRRYFLSGSIKQLSTFQRTRLTLSCHLRETIEYYIMYHKNLMYELDFWERGKNSMVEKRRIQFEKIRDSLRQEKRNESVQCWRDMLSVERDIRAILKEYMELSIKKRLLLK